MTAPHETDFDDWLIETFREAGAFTILIVLVGIGDVSVALLRSAYLHVIGDETRWPEMTALFERAGVPWDGVALFRAGPEGLVDDATARQRLAALTRRLNQDRSLLNEGAFFDRRGLSLKIEEISAPPPPARG
jgi:hypothetical protein